MRWKPLAISLLLGLILQAAIAILICWATPGLPSHRAATPSVSPVWSDHLPEELGPFDRAVTLEGFGRTCTQVTWRKQPGQPDGLFCVYEGGWPCRSLSCAWLNLYSGGGWSYPSWGTWEVPQRLQARWCLKDGQGTLRVVPVRPLVSGTLLNSLAWGAALFGASRVIAGVRARRRRVKGLCKRCAYNVKGLAACPECGEPSPAPAGPIPA